MDIMGQMSHINTKRNDVKKNNQWNFLEPPSLMHHSKWEYLLQKHELRRLTKGASNTNEAIHKVDRCGNNNNKESKHIKQANSLAKLEALLVTITTNKRKLEQKNQTEIGKESLCCQRSLIYLEHTPNKVSTDFTIFFLCRAVFVRFNHADIDNDKNNESHQECSEQKIRIN